MAFEKLAHHTHKIDRQIVNRAVFEWSGNKERMLVFFVHADVSILLSVYA